MKNNLALVILTTKKEYTEGALHKCLDRYLNYCEPGCKIDIIICTNVCIDNNLDRYVNHVNVNCLNVYSCDITPMEDVYIQDYKPVDSPLELGQSNGPNQLFFRAFEYLKTVTYDYLMVVECDTQPLTKNWMLKLSQYCNRNNFLIAGSVYKGVHKLPDKEWAHHLNGVALYNNCDELHTMLNDARELLHFYVHRKRYVMLNYDIAIWFHVNQPEKQELKNMLIDTDIISNYSMAIDVSIDIETVLLKHPNTIILHQKQQN